MPAPGPKILLLSGCVCVKFHAHLYTVSFNANVVSGAACHELVVATNRLRGPLRTQLGKHSIIGRLIVDCSLLCVRRCSRMLAELWMNVKTLVKFRPPASTTTTSRTSSLRRHSHLCVPEVLLREKLHNFLVV